VNVLHCKTPLRFGACLELLRIFSGFKNFETGAESISGKVTPTASGFNYYFFPPSALWHPCCLEPLLFGGGDDEPVSVFHLCNVTKNENQPKTTRILKTEIKVNLGPVFAFSLVRRKIHTPFTLASYVTVVDLGCIFSLCKIRLE